MFSNYTVLCIHGIINSTALAKRANGHLCSMTYFKSNNHINTTIIQTKMLSKLTNLKIFDTKEQIMNFHTGKNYSPWNGTLKREI